jgi:hypothetical protein
MNWLTVLTAIPSLFEAITNLVKQFEVPGVAGPDKKSAVLAVIAAGLSPLPKMGLTVPTTMILTVADAIIDAVVSAFNAFGVFKKDPPK